MKKWKLRGVRLRYGGLQCGEDGFGTHGTALVCRPEVTHPRVCQGRGVQSGRVCVEVELRVRSVSTQAYCQLWRLHSSCRQTRAKENRLVPTVSKFYIEEIHRCCFPSSFLRSLGDGTGPVNPTGLSEIFIELLSSLSYILSGPLRGAWRFLRGVLNWVASSLRWPLWRMEGEVISNSH